MKKFLCFVFPFLLTQKRCFHAANIATPVPSEAKQFRLIPVKGAGWSILFRFAFGLLQLLIMCIVCLYNPLYQLMTYNIFYIKFNFCNTLYLFQNL